MIEEEGKNSSPAQEIPKVLTSTKNILLWEDNFGLIIDSKGKRHFIKRFTWKNHNQIQVQVITYGARIVSIKTPSRKGIVEDIVLGFDNIEGYLHYDKTFMGATIGRITDKIEKATCVVDSKQIWLSKNDKNCHSNGGFKGLDKAIWNHYVEDTVVYLSHVSSHREEGYPGDLFVQIRFELTKKNEFKICMEAHTTLPTVVNLSNLVYFNLGGHSRGREELLRHLVTVNANCSLMMRDDCLPTGQIRNVLYTRNDFQIPTVMKNKIPDDFDPGFNEYMCVNRGVEQGVCFVARALHPPSGRVLEVYSDQYGVRFSTADNIISKPAYFPPDETKQEISKEECALIELIDMLYERMGDILNKDSKANYEELKTLIVKMRKIKLEKPDDSEEEEEECHEEENNEEENDEEEQLEESNQDSLVILNPLQAEYLQTMREVALEHSESETDFSRIIKIVNKILSVALVKDELEMPTKPEENLNEKEKVDVKPKCKKSTFFKNVIPESYKDGRIHGKNQTIYNKQGAICFQTQNYPNAIYHKNFPNSVLHPGETYKHTIVYKFWIQSGDPNRWIKRQNR